MHEDALDGLDRVGHDELGRLAQKLAPVAHLAAGLRIEGRLVEDDLRLVALVDLVDALVPLDDRQHLSGAFERLVPGEHRLLDARGDLLVDRLDLFLARSDPGGPRLVALLLHGSLVTRLVDLEVHVPRHVRYEVERKPEGVVQFEQHLARDHGLLLCLELRNRFVRAAPARSRASGRTALLR